jgi:hypothetical protein
MTEPVPIETHQSWLDDAVGHFKNDLAGSDDYQILIKYIFSSKIWYFQKYLGHDGASSNALMDELNEIVSKNFNVSFKDILVVGSAKTGFSMNPYNSLRKFDLGEKESDLDVAIVSNGLFDYYWQLLRNCFSVKSLVEYDKISKGIFRGYISNHAMTRVPEVRREFNSIKNTTTKKVAAALRIKHPINYRIYRSWFDLQDYHLAGIKQLRAKPPL